jgi:hypothetical protein
MGPRRQRLQRLLAKAHAAFAVVGGFVVVARGLLAGPLALARLGRLDRLGRLGERMGLRSARHRLCRGGRPGTAAPRLRAGLGPWIDLRRRERALTAALSLRHRHAARGAVPTACGTRPDLATRKKKVRLTSRND